MTEHHSPDHPAAPDFISQVVAKARAQSKNPPKLNRRADKIRWSEQSLEDRVRARKVRAIGRESGPDGRAKRRGLGVPRLGEVLREAIVTQGWEEELGHGWIFGNWESLVGETVAAHTTPDRVEEKILHVNCDHSSWATNLRYLQAQILTKIASHIGDGIIVELRLHGPKQHRNYTGPQWVRPQGSNDTYG